MDHQPVVAIVGQAARSAIDGNYQQEVDLISLFKDVAGEYVCIASSPVQIRHLVDHSMRIAQAERSVTCIIIPKDVQELDAVEQPPHAHNTLHTGLGYPSLHLTPSDADLKPNLFLCDGSLLPTQGSANPGVAIQALAARTADYLISEGEDVLSERPGTVTRPPVRQNLSPAGTSGKGVPHIK